MAASRIKGITIQIGGDTTGLNDALEKTNKKISGTQSQLKDVNRLLKLDPTNVTLLEQKQRLLSSAVEDTSGKLDTLREASTQAAKSAEKYDAWKAAYDPIQTEIDETRKKLKELRDQQQELADGGSADTDAYRELTEQAQKAAQELSELKKQAKAVSDEFGNPISPDQYNALQREIADTEIRLRDMNSEAEETAAKIRKIDEKPIEDVEDAARQAGEALDDAEKEAADFGDVLKAELISEAASGIVDSLKDVAEETKEYRRIMASLEQSSENAGYSAEETSAAYQKLYGVLADEQSAATTLANLQALGLSQGDLMNLIDGTIGGWAKYGDSIPIDGLAEAVNHTAKLGEVQGVLADVLEWAGISTDAFNRRLSYCATEEERVNAIAALFASQGLTEMGKGWQETNASLVESNQANARMQEQLAQLGELVEPVFTKVTNAVATALEWFNGLDSGTQTFILTVAALVAGIGPLTSAITGVSNVVNILSSVDIAGLTSVFGNLTGKVLPALQNGFTTVFSFIAANPVVMLVAAIAAMVVAIGTHGDEIQAILQKVDDFLQGVFARDWTETFGPVLGGALNGFFDGVKIVWDSVKEILDGIIDFIRGVFTGDWERAWGGVQSIFSGIFSGLVAIAQAPINGLIDLVNGFIDVINIAIQAVNNLLGLNLQEVEKIPHLISQPGNSPAKAHSTSGRGASAGKFTAIPMLASGGELFNGSAIVGEAGAELLTVAGGRAIVQPLGGTTNHNTNLGGVSIVVYGAPGQNVRELADIVMAEMQSSYSRKEAAL